MPWEKKPPAIKRVDLTIPRPGKRRQRTQAWHLSYRKHEVRERASFIVECHCAENSIQEIPQWGKQRGDEVDASEAQ